jgi:hypothetical protein
LVGRKASFQGYTIEDLPPLRGETSKLRHVVSAAAEREPRAGQLVKFKNNVWQPTVRTAGGTVACGGKV